VAVLVGITGSPSLTNRAPSAPSRRLASDKEDKKKKGVRVQDLYSTTTSTSFVVAAIAPSTLVLYFVYLMTVGLTRRDHEV